MMKITISTTQTGNSFFHAEGLPTIGSGVIVSEDGYIITNNHVIAGTDDGLFGLPSMIKHIYCTRCWQGSVLLTWQF